MFDVGFAELFLLTLIGLLVLGPERLPQVARTIGSLVRQARQSWAVMRRSIEAELASAEAANPIRDVKKDLEQIGRDISSIPESLTAAAEGKTVSDPEEAGADEEVEQDDGRTAD